MSELIDRIPGRESLVAKLRGVVELTAQLKARQRLSGRSGQLGYAINSSDAWDYSGSVAFTNATYNSAQFRIVFTGDGTQPFPIAVPQFDVRINGTGSGNKMVFDPSLGTYVYEDSSVQMDAFDYGKPISSYFASEDQSGWLLTLFHIGKTGTGNFQVRIKARAQASCGGAFSIVRIA